MKRKLTITGILAATLALTTTSCTDFLTENPKTAITEDKMFSDVKYAQTNLEATYTKWRDTFKDRYLWELLVGTDEVQSGALQALKSGPERASLDTYDANLNSETSFTTEQWTMRYPIVASAAKLIDALRADNLSKDTDQGRIFGEASFIRGSLTMELAMLWGEVPLIDRALNAEHGYGRRPLKEVWQFIIDDLRTAAAFCPEKNEPGRGTRYAANMMLAKALMAAPEETGLRDFAAASKALEEVFKGPFRLVDYYDLWDYTKGNTAESIMEWQFKPVWPDNNQIQFQIGSRAVATFFGDACFMSGYDHAVPTKYAYSMRSEGGLWEEGDIRREEAIRYDFTYYGVTPDLSKIQWEDLGNDYDELLPHIKKYEDFRTDNHSGLGINNMWFSGKNIPFLRLADAYLLYAECLNELGRTDEAIEWVNKVRSRAWENNLPADKAWKLMTQDEFRTQILDERMRELFAERWCKFDLIRTGKLLSLTKARNKWTAKAGVMDQHNVRWPIPLSEINQNEDISQEDQNEGYR